MVLNKTSTQYKFLQVLTGTYLAMYNGLQSASCISNPSLDTDCTDANDYVVYEPPSLPEKGDLYAKSDGPADFDYSYDTPDTLYKGLTAATFIAPFTTNLNTAAVSVLYAACAANSKCSTSYSSTGASSADAVIQALVTTNINTITSILKANSNLYYIPYNSYGQGAVLSSVYLQLPSAGNQLYGINDGVLAAITEGTVNATTYLEQRQIGQMLQYGFENWEILIHTAVLGSYGYNLDTPAQSNINLTAPQVFKKLTYGGSDMKHKRSPVRHTKLSKAQRLPRYLDPLTTPLLADRTVCTPPDTQSSINFLQAVDSGCLQPGFLSAALAPRSPMLAPLAALATSNLPSTYNAQSFADVLFARTAQFCTAGIDGFPCYPGVDVWDFNATRSVFTYVADVAANSAQIGGADLQTANLFCAGAPGAIAAYQQDLSCCSVYCQGPTCQTVPEDGTPGTGVC